MYLTWVIFLYLPIFIYKDERGETDAHKHFACLSKSDAQFYVATKIEIYLYFYSLLFSAIPITVGPIIDIMAS